MATANKLHQLMTLALVRKFNEDGLELIAASNFHELNSPSIIGRHCPDVIAKDSDGNIYIGEAKIGEGLDTQKTKEQFSDFLKLKSPNGSMAEVHIITESAYYDKLKELIEEWKLNEKRLHLWTY